MEERADVTAQTDVHSKLPADRASIAMYFLIRMLQQMFSSSSTPENAKLLTIFMLLGLLASVLFAQTSLALGAEWRKPF